MRKILSILLVMVLFMACDKSDKAKLKNEDNVSDTRDYEVEMLDYEKIYLLSNKYDLEVDKIKTILISYFKNTPLLDFEGEFDYSEIIEDISLKNNVSKKTISLLILDYGHN